MQVRMVPRSIVEQVICILTDNTIARPIGLEYPRLNDEQTAIEFSRNTTSARVNQMTRQLGLQAVVSTNRRAFLNVESSWTNALGLMGIKAGAERLPLEAGSTSWGCSNWKQEWRTESIMVQWMGKDTHTTTVTNKLRSCIAVNWLVRVRTQEEYSPSTHRNANTYQMISLTVNQIISIAY